MTDTTAAARAQALLDRLNRALADRDFTAASRLFAEECYWRDLVLLTWNIKTLEGQGQIADMLAAQLDAAAPVRFALDEREAVEEADGVVSAWIVVDTRQARGGGHVRIRDGRIWTLLTAAQELKGHEEPLGTRRPMGAEHGIRRGRQTWLERRRQEAEELGREKQPFVLVIGGGQGGIALGARLRQLGVSHIVIDRHARPGDQWRNRYKSLCLHDPVWYDHLPYLPFPDNWPVFAPKDKIGDWLEMYTRVMEVNYWPSTTCLNARFDEDRQEWEVTVERDGETLVLRPKHLVFATGMSGKANVPKIQGQDVFQGEQQHSSQHPGPDAYAGKKVVVIGTNNSAHDICAALWEHGADVTMVQRSSTHIVRSESLMEIGLGDLYSERAVASGMTTKKADLTFASLPYRIMADFQVPVYDRIRERDAEFYRKLEATGFMLDFGDDDSGLFMKYLRRASGYYIDVGACDLVIDGSIQLQAGKEISHLSANAVVLEDGTELPADLVVYATGYGSMNGWVADLISQEVADKVGKVWGLGSDTTKDPGPWEGEQRNMWKPTQQEALWFHGGNLHQSRHYSLYLALQLKARQEGLPVQVYGLQQVHHLR
ncbi:NAD(P)/FAD-dependent oxidoreductase [Acidovorax sp. GBBC 3332]|nr:MULTISPECIES: NAD(P)/FAD-dependent oxidoreductase [unclassified Acidovorax]MDA8450443.1 NAD(P)/FAD-dependent oxidoreductase [Acidovorax sp. GBBC 3297]MDA8459883.1 NAD(P)/FAD-dependent oxidoreductase [Acidovorax sp. GBBC 3333]MDA8464919.1 NAD(P)/FAD-dependent oxidoreductase [Acidovorax sp. GBBC 3332]MDA8469958.1 NAD(P)/FAD-dependent oxidoreductase [Acidovorax sp. GBBC 3299]